MADDQEAPQDQDEVESKRIREGKKKSTSRQQRRARSSQRRSKRQLFYLIGGFTVAGLLILSLLLPSLPFSPGSPDDGGSNNELATPDTPNPEEGAPVVDVGIQVLDQGRTHIPVGAPHPRYNSNPPTSGWHYETPGDWGIYDVSLLDETFVHNMEHGGIIFSYHLDDQAKVDALIEFVEGQPGFPSCFIAQPYENIDEGSIALTAWNWIETFKEIDVVGMQSFIDAHKNRGPEYLGATCGGGARMTR